MPFCLVSPRDEKKGFYSIIQIMSILLLAKKNNDNKMREKNIYNMYTFLVELKMIYLIVEAMLL